MLSHIFQKHVHAPHRPRKLVGFTLVELLIVVVILAILAAVVIPQFENTSASAKESALAASLRTVRQSIALYRVQHNESYPGQSAGGNGDWTEFVNHMICDTDQDGLEGGSFGPYLRTGFPTNPITSTNTGKNAATLPSGPSGAEAYVYVPTTGELRANVAGNAPSGLAYWDL
jgi:prepilin-type N-terminal cleavage/methylation domain-containing protein